MNLDHLKFGFGIYSTWRTHKQEGILNEIK